MVLELLTRELMEVLDTEVGRRRRIRDVGEVGDVVGRERLPHATSQLVRDAALHQLAQLRAHTSVRRRPSVLGPRSLQRSIHTSATGASAQLPSHAANAASQASRCCVVSNENGKRVRSSRDGDRCPTTKPYSSVSHVDGGGVLMVGVWQREGGVAYERPRDRPSSSSGIRARPLRHFGGNQLNGFA